MSGRWGINRTVGQIFAVLYISKQSVSADDIVEILGCSRSNVSMGLKELESWHLVRLHHLPGDRREYFSTFDDVWEIVRVVAAERRRREIDPTLSMLRNLLKDMPDDESARATQARLRELYEVIDLLAGCSEDVRKLPSSMIVRLLKLGGQAARLLYVKNKLPAILTASHKIEFRRKVMCYQEESQP